MPPNSIQTGLIERAKARLPQTETGVDCLKVPLTLNLEGEGFRCSSRRHLIPRSDRWVTCQRRRVRPERSGLRKLTAALLWPLIWMCCVKRRALSGLLTYSHTSRKGWYSLNFICFYKCLCQCSLSLVDDVSKKNKNVKIWVMFMTLFAVDAYGGV